MEEISWRTRLRNEIERVADDDKSSLLLSGIQIFLFGSAARSSSPNDLDLAILYDAQHFTIRMVLELRALLSAMLQESCGLSVDVVVLNFQEASQSHFLQEAGAIRLI